MRLDRKAIKWLVSVADDASRAKLLDALLGACSQLGRLPGPVRSSLLAALAHDDEKRDRSTSLGYGGVSDLELCSLSAARTRSGPDESARALSTVLCNWPTLWLRMLNELPGDLPRDVLGGLPILGRDCATEISFRHWIHKENRYFPPGRERRAYLASVVPDVNHIGARATLLHWCGIRLHDTIDVYEFMTIRRARPVDDPVAFYCAVQLHLDMARR